MLLLITTLLLPIPMDASSDIEAFLDDFHLAAAEADAERYFAHFTDDAVYLGTDAGERWTVADFRAYAEPYFSKGRGWVYVASERNVTVAASGTFAWFDERLQNAKYGEVRGSGVLERQAGAWRIRQYNLAFPVPNDDAAGVTKRAKKAERVGEPRGTEYFAADGDRALVLWNKVVPRLIDKPAKGDEDAEDAKAPEGGAGTPPPIVVLLPSATFSARATWDLPLRDYSVMSALARRGFDVFAVELGGYGLSSPPTDDPAGGCASATRDLGIALERIAELRGDRPVLLVGPSWGSQVAGAYAQEHPERVRALVLYGFRWKSRVPESVVREVFGDEALDGPRRAVTSEAARGDFIPGYYEEDVPERFEHHLLAQGKIVPSGPLRDYVEELPLVDPARLEVPTLLLYGRLEFELPDPENEGEVLLFDEHRAEQRAFFTALPGPKHWMELPGAGHSAHLDTPHDLFQRCLAGWLERQP